MEEGEDEFQTDDDDDMEVSEPEEEKQEAQKRKKVFIYSSIFPQYNHFIFCIKMVYYLYMAACF